MMKIVGIVMIAISVLQVGLLYYEKYKLRPNSIDWFIKLLSAYRFELKWSRKSLIEILNNVSYEKYNSYIAEVIDNSKYENLSDSFIDKNNQFKMFKLKEDDVSILRYFLKESGKSNLETELSLCEKTLNALESKKQEASVDFKKLGPLSVKLGIIIAVWIIVMLV